MQVTHAQTSGSLLESRPTILERFRFIDGAHSAGLFLQLILAQYKRRQWDNTLEDTKLVTPVIDRTLIVIKELQKEQVLGHSERELLYKRVIFRD